MENLDKQHRDKSNIIVFFIVCFGMTALMGIVMAFAYSRGSVDAFPLVQMYYPAMGVMVAFLCNKEIRSRAPKKFFGVFLIFSMVSVILISIQTFTGYGEPEIVAGILVTAGSFMGLIMLGIEDKKTRAEFGLSINKNGKKSVFYIILFVALYLLANFISCVMSGSLSDFFMILEYPAIFKVLLLLPLNFLLTYFLFFGEEYGWRYFLQPVLQNKFGKRRGVLLLGVIWGLWHFPINLFYYSPETSFYSVVTQLIVCICYSVFFGYVYLKTENIWAVSMIHYLNNTLGFVLFGADGSNVVISGQDVIISLVIFGIIYLPFLATKEYRKKTPISKELNQ
ncbi:type II CAAX endopeptidase family protein [Clostridium sp.]|uniref:CPBP family intramembrane glutamic endopeptidase n=1 Tax=Clostridium sp. TaxID=1506 RepID=UPI003217A262